MFSGRVPSDSVEIDLGARVRALRHERGLTLKGLGRLAGLSHPFLSQLERGLAQPSMSSVERIAAALDVSMASLWAPSRSDEPVQLVRSDDGEAGADGIRVLGGLPGTPVLREWTARTRRWPAEPTVESGEIAIYVARGAVEVELGDAVHALKEGDTLRFDGATPHRLRRTGPTSTRALIVTAG